MESLKKVNELQEILKSLQPLKPDSQKALDKKFQMEFNYNSNHIEGNTLTYGETELLLFFDKTQGNHDLREYEEMKAHDVAYRMIREWAADSDFVLSEIHIRQLNKIILVKPFWKEAITPDLQSTRRQIKVGAYKEFSNSVRLQSGEMFEFASPADTPAKMHDLMTWFNSEFLQPDMNPVTLAADFHHRFVLIHPFDDGNGRIARLLVNYLMLKHGLPPVIIKSADKKNYLHALNQADTGNLTAFVKYLADQLIWSLNLSIKSAKGESVEEPEDLDKKLLLLERELNAGDPNEQIQQQLTREFFSAIFHGWLGELIREAVLAIQKFNRLFASNSHSIHLASGLCGVNFNSETPEEILAEFGKKLADKTVPFQDWESRTAIHAQFNSLIKGGMKTFSCHYSIELIVDRYKYTILVDEFTEENPRKQTKLYERLLHKPVTEADRQEIISKLTGAIYQNIDYHTKKIGLRKW